MEDLSKTLSDLLSNPEKMEKLSHLASSVMGTSSPAVPASAPEPESVSVQAQTTVSESAPASGISSLLPRLDEIMNSVSIDNETTALLQALKPHLSPARAACVDDAIRLLQLIKALSLLGDSCLLGGKNHGD